MFGLDHKVAVITGASGALAGSVAKSLAKAGVALALLSRNEDAIAPLLKEISNLGGRAESYSTDILSETSLLTVKDAILTRFWTY